MSAIWRCLLAIPSLHPSTCGEPGSCPQTCHRPSVGTAAPLLSASCLSSASNEFIDPLICAWLVPGALGDEKVEETDAEVFISWEDRHHSNPAALPLGMLRDLFLYQFRAEPGKLSEWVLMKQLTGDISFCPDHFPLREGL